MIFLQLFISFAKVGLLGFGGGLAIVRLIYDSIQPFMNMSQEMFANIVAISQITPGPLAVNTATYVGYEAAGIAGAAAATFGVVLPEFILISIVARMIRQFRDSKIVNGAITGMRPAVMGIIGAAVVTLTVPSIAGESRLGTGLLDSLGISLTHGAAGAFLGLPVDVISILMA
ncbi:MAG: chromate transporter, partial [Clostridiales bacterium]|nr:chromate transporter [Clostridiales bacterium]